MPVNVIIRSELFSAIASELNSKDTLFPSNVYDNLIQLVPDA